MNPQLHTELWTSWASLLRSYAAAHGLNSTRHAVVEVSAEQITLRVGTRWLRFSAAQLESSDAPSVAFRLEENGTVCIDDGPEEEMDLAAEHLARKMLST